MTNPYKGIIAVPAPNTSYEGITPLPPPPTAPNFGDEGKAPRQEVTNSVLEEHSAKVAVILDISYSMDKSFMSKNVNKILKKATEIASTFDDDGNLEVFTFGEEGIYRGSVKSDNIDEFVDKMIEKGGGIGDTGNFLESRTNYSEGMKVANEFYFPKGAKKTDKPVFALFVTDGDCTPNNRPATREQLISISKNPIFFKIVAVGVNPDENSFVQELDDLKGRKIDNCDTVFSPNFDVSFEQLLKEYRGFVIQAEGKKMFTGDTGIKLEKVGFEGRIQAEKSSCCVIL